MTTDTTRKYRRMNNEGEPSAQDYADWKMPETEEGQAESNPIAELRQTGLETTTPIHELTPDQAQAILDADKEQQKYGNEKENAFVEKYMGLVTNRTTGELTPNQRIDAETHLRTLFQEFPSPGQKWNFPVYEGINETPVDFESYDQSELPGN